MSVVVANGGLMPRSVPLGDAPDAAAPHEFSNVYLVQHDAALLWLGDVIAQPDWLPIANAVSIGDLLLSTGLAGWAFVAALEARRRTV